MAIAGGIVLLLAGFVYDVLFAGIPYQDPTPEMQQRYERHRGIATAIELLGVAITLSGCLVWLVRRLLRKRA